MLDAKQIGTDKNPIEGVHSRSINTRELSVTEPAVYVSSSNGVVLEPFLASNYATGGAAIEAALGSLPQAGGKIYIPSHGPDSVVDKAGVQRDDVWAIDRDLATGGKNGVSIVGDGPGWEGSATDLICSDSSVTSMLTMDGGFLDTIRYIGFDAADKATNCVDLGGGTPNNDWQMWGCMATAATNANILLTGDKNFWIQNCWSEYSSAGIKTSGSVAPGRIWVDNFLTARNDIDIHITKSCGKLRINNADSEKSGERFLLVDNANLSNARITNCSATGASNTLGGAAVVRFQSNGNNTFDNIQFIGNHYDGGSSAGRAVNTNDPTAIGDLRFEKETIIGMTIEDYGPNIRANARIDGEIEQSANAETPTSTGIVGKINFTDSGDGSGSGLYLEDKDGTIHGPV